MTKYNDNSSDARQWTTGKLMDKLRSYTNLETFNGNLPEGYTPKTGAWADDGDIVRQITMQYRQVNMEPILNELERRFMGIKNA